MKIDVAKIEGFDAMSAEDKINALMGFEFEAPAADSADEVNKLKTALSKSNSEAAEYKRKLKEKLTESEAAEQARAEEEAKMRERLAELEKKDFLSTHKANFLGAGYSAELAESSANAMADGNWNQVFEDLKKFTEETVAKTKAEYINGQPKGSSGKTPSSDDLEKEALAKFRRAAGLK